MRQVRTIDCSGAAAFVRRHTERVVVPLVPEIPLHLATDPRGIFQEAELIGAAHPFWAFAWPGGQGLARWLLDHPEAVAGKRVLDVGAGTAISSIAAMMAGARQVVANDTDPLACAAATANAAFNGMAIMVSSEDLLDATPEADLILIGDLFYQPDIAMRVSAFLVAARRRGIPVLYADRTTASRPPLQLELLAGYQAPLIPAMELDYIEHCHVWRIA